MTETNGNYQEAFKVRGDIVQRDVYAFETELRLLDKGIVQPDTILTRAFEILQGMGYTIHSTVESAHHLKAGIKAGWIASPETDIETIQNGRGTKTRYLLDGEDVDDLHAGKVRWYGMQVKLAFEDAIRIPDPNL